MSLIAAAGGIDWTWWGNLAQGILALGLVILIHEFGHFAAAKLCGVKVEKFYIGFDVFGLRLFRFRWGETEYGIGALPLGGYVYMLGQTDNPAKQAEEAERAKKDAAEGKPVDPEAAAVWDPRSYPAQSVPERMLIISAGVILNAVSAYFIAALAYGIGVENTPAAIGEVSPGGPAWQAGLQPGDDILKIDGIRDPRFEADLRTRAVLADLERGLPMTVRRGEKEFELTIHPRKLRPDFPPTLGILGPRETRLVELPDGKSPTVEGSPARRATPAFTSGDKVTKIGQFEIKSYTDVLEALVVDADKKVPVVVVRETKNDKGETTASETLTIEVDPRPFRTLGMTMEIGAVSGVQNGSPAEAAGYKAGDKLVSIDGEPLGDPMTLAERMRRKQVEDPAAKWSVVVERTVDGKPQPVTLDVTPRKANVDEVPLFPGSPLSIPTLGIAFQVLPKVAAVAADGPAAKAGVKPGDVFTKLVTKPTDEPLEDTGSKPRVITVELTEEDYFNWPFVATNVLQTIRPGTKIELTTADNRTLTLEPVDEPGFFQADRGLQFASETETRQAHSAAEAFDFAWYDTKDSLTQVYRFLHAIWIGQIPASSVGGVITIADQAGQSASRGFTQLLLFIVMLSCNLAVLNFLPFPVLDGGHMVFLIYEGIFRRPPPERLFIALNMLGLVCLLSLMLFALTMDIFRLAR